MTRTVSARLRWASSALAGLMLVLAAPAVQALPSFEEVRREHRPSDTQVLDRDGEWLQTLRTDPSVRRGPWVVLEDKEDFYRVKVDGQEFWVDSMDVRTAPVVKAKCTLGVAEKKQPVGATMGAGVNPCAAP
jgi:hypothetical protein